MSTQVAGAATAELSAWLDSPRADDGSAISELKQFADLFSNEDAYKIFSSAILCPPLSIAEEHRIKRSYRAMQLLTQDLAAAPESSVFMNATRAGLLAKDIFAALLLTTTTAGGSNGADTTSAPTNDCATAYVLHARKLLDALLDSYPSSVISAAGAGGKDGMEAHLRPLLLAETSSQTLSTLTNLIVHGCTGNVGQPSAERTAQAAYQQKMKPSTITHGHRRKFVRNLSEWGFLSQIVECINDDFVLVGEDLCETVLTIVECLGNPERDAGVKLPTESVGEHMVLAPLGRTEWWDLLFDKLQDSNHITRVTVTRVMMGIFTLTTGSSKRIRSIGPPMTDATENYDAGATKQKKPADQTYEHKNKLLEWGLTTKIHQALISHIAQISQSITMKEEQGSTTYWNRGDDKESIPGVPHPGRCRIVPFSSWRLHMIVLLAEIITYNGDTQKPSSSESLRYSAMTEIMKLPLVTSSLPEATTTVADNSSSIIITTTTTTNNNNNNNNNTAINPWPLLCDWVFEYPENNLYHFQFIRMFRAIVLEHHEPTLRLVLQKTKFVSRAVKTCKSGPGPIRGILMECLNMLRLRSQSIPPSAFLRQFLYSHDGWKAFQDALTELTMAQRFGGKPIPGQEVVYIKNMGIDLGSKYATDLGFDGIDVFMDEMVGPAALAAVTTTPSASTSDAINGSGKKKKKKRK